ncbi:MAG: serine protease, peptidase S9 family protein, partial [Acinetobacter sp.]
SLSIQSITPSYDGKKVLIAYATQGAEVSTLKVLDVGSKQFLKDNVYPASNAGLSWAFDNKSFLYVWLKTDDNKDPKARLNTKTKLHVLGEDNTADRDFFSNESYPDLKIDPRVYPYAILNKNSRIYIFSGEYSVQPEFKMHYAPIGQLKSKKVNWQVLCSPADKLVRGMELVGDHAYAITYNQAKNYRLIATNLQHPDWANATTIAAEKSDQTLESITHSKDFLFLTYSDGKHLKKNFKE